MILDLTTSRLCYLISREVEEINPVRFKKGQTTYSDIVKLAVLNLYNEVTTTDDKDLNLIYEPMELEDIVNFVKYYDDITESKKQRQNIAMWEERI